MGLSVNSSETFEYVFEDQRALPADQQRKLVFRYLSARDHSRMEEYFEQCLKQTSVDSVIDSALCGIEIGFVNWIGFGVEYKPTDDDDETTLDDVLSRADIMELVSNLSQAMTVNQREKKASVLLSLSTLAKSAGAGLMGNASPTAVLN